MSRLHLITGGGGDEPPKPPPGPPAPPPDGDGTPYGLAGLRAELAKMAAQTKPGRNVCLFNCACNVIELVNGGELAPGAVQQLADVAMSTGLPPDEVGRTLRSARDKVGGAGRTAPPRGEDGGGDTAGGTTDDQADDTDGRSLDDLYPRIDWATFWDANNDIEWLVRPILPRGRIVSNFSPPKAGKSILALDISASLATGRACLGNPAQQPIRVLYIDQENTAEDLRLRLDDMGYGPEHNKLLTDNLIYLSFAALPPLDTRGGGQMLMALIAHHQPELVILDTLSRFIEGEENSADTYNNLYRHVTIGCKAAGVTVWRLDHTGKDIDKGQRGSSAKDGDLDLAWLMDAETHADGSARVTLRRHVTRIPLPSEYVVCTRGEDPDTGLLTHRVTETMNVKPGVDPAKVAELVTILDDGQVDTAWGRVKVRKWLAEHRKEFEPPGNNVISSAQEQRRLFKNLFRP